MNRDWSTGDVTPKGLIACRVVDSLNRGTLDELHLGTGLLMFQALGDMFFDRTDGDA